MTDIAAFTRLIEHFRSIPRSTPPPQTFMEISGYPHLENVCSNILQFYLSPDADHRLGSLLLEALFATIGVEPGQLTASDTTVERELSTDRRNRIDLVIGTDRHIVGIENKIFAGVTNDLDHYSAFLQREGRRTGKDAILILLTLLPTRRPESPAIRDFHCITYEQWFTRIQEQLGARMLECDHRYLLYLTDFMNTLKGLSGGSNMNEELLRFLAANRDAVTELASQMRETRNTFRKDIKELSGLVQYDEENGVRQWVWSGDTEYPLLALVHDLPTLGDRQLAVDTYLDPTGWRTVVFTRKDGPEDLGAWLDQRGVEIKEVSHGKKLTKMVVQEFAHSTPTITVAEQLNDLLKRLC